MESIQNTYFRFGRTEPKAFKPHCEPGDWMHIDSFKFEPEPLPEGLHDPDDPDDDMEARPYVFVTPLGHYQESAPAVVPLVTELTSEGFDLWARNSDCGWGVIGFNWMALEVTGGASGETVRVDARTVFPKHFSTDCEAGDWQDWTINFSPPSHAWGEQTFLLTAADLHVQPVAPPSTYGGSPLDSQHAPLVPQVRQYNLSSEGSYATDYAAFARNSGWEANGALNGVVAGRVESDTASQLSVEAGRILPEHFGAKWHPDCWVTWQIAFHDVFVAPPVVILTAMDAEDPWEKEGRPRPEGSQSCAPAGVASDISMSGFTLNARNTDCAHGFAGFYWAAFGCPTC